MLIFLELYFCNLHMKLPLEFCASNVQEEYASFPEGEMLKSIIKGYEEKRGFPNCGGRLIVPTFPSLLPTIPMETP